MKILIKNLGPIKRGEIPLNSDLLFFVGYNNSGKSYATQLIWAIYNEKFRNNFLDELNYNKITKVKKIENFLFTKNIAIKILEEFEKYIEDKIHLIFNLNKEEFKRFKINFLLDDNEIETLIDQGGQEYTIQKIGDDSKTVIIRRKYSSKLNIEGNIEDIDFDILKRKIIEFYFFSIIDAAQSFFLPAIRGAYVNLFQYINRYEKEKKDMLHEFLSDKNKVDINKVFSLIEESNSSYTMATNFLINKLTELSPDTKESEKYIEFIDIVKDIIGGEIVKKDSKIIGNSKFYLSINGKKELLPMHISSSTTNQLAPLYLFFKYWGHKAMSDMLIVDEPEENLHPENQIKFLNMIFKFVENNNKALITSHSPLLTKLLNSHIAFNELSDVNKEQITAETGFKSFDFINKNNVKVCFFNGEEILAYPVTEYGTMFKDFVKVEDTVNNQFRLITNKVFEQNE